MGIANRGLQILPLKYIHLWSKGMDKIDSSKMKQSMVKSLYTGKFMVCLLLNDIDLWPNCNLFML